VFRAAVIAAAMLLAVGVCAEETPARDPMQPFGSAVAAAAAQAASAPRFVLTGVLISPTRRVALVNGRPYTPGDTIDGAEVVAVEPAAVRFREHGVEFVISLGQPRSGRPPTAQGETVP
jgi:hypothetical protein